MKIRFSIELPSSCNLSLGTYQALCPGDDWEMKATCVRRYHVGPIPDAPHIAAADFTTPLTWPPIGNVQAFLSMLASLPQ